MISVRGLTKRYGEFAAVDHLNLRVEKGEFYSLLGPNGAGKTTTINMLNTLLDPSEGSVSINGLSLNADRNSIRRQIGVVPQEISLYDELSAFDNLRFFGSLYGITESLLRVRIHHLLEEFGLIDRMNEKIKHYSGGMKRRINIASALLHQPALVFMDEPTVGIDPQSRNNIYEAIQRLRKDGVTILYTTHYMEEAERFSDRIGIIDHGTIIAEGTLAQLYTRAGHGDSMVIELAEINEKQFIQIQNLNGVVVSRTENRIQFHGDDLRKKIPSIMLMITELGLDLIHLDIRKPDLEAVFLSLTGKNLRD
ncbi:MAG TPA: export ABC transporter ATP-binding protein [Flavobacteriales bacterium]|nr:export ABC transporter ATP-binding protein [Flavobacteriales bacterium]HCA82240.1 export ABC transporter ATP-binding protein [Flavobacteriales bacterium]HRE73789.1 ABC transporter ATP-binding protein [Flavobacteriales bacterium]HRE95687.1 ABC transporter ATP-binding protein [Flavobacteriales bacterium]HRJ35896.1 ABC transporter ATP-binding protein [Flavobacteriales bacterium]